MGLQLVGPPPSPILGRYEKPCNARQSFNILVDGVADGAGEAAQRRPRSFDHFFHDFCVMMSPNELAKIPAPKTF
ncbi:hypothetical protein GGTG_14462 [Gaeumannomyces tritici R3-111a-1]|uniref:Uncharacterized protein n=1 Tax=Gaeumannomyces tritici (strain R3-111a-1) TaxID=644352 RepID=J3PLI3_GAET3|nr:hypothetical protein GGTG_14462 [Gaeumannomyces tritici R3-111a-1]EJT67961.1 hypothetical protein GGTG_14462 [Gaeumannomyces tritici R3-111a-1]